MNRSHFFYLQNQLVFLLLLSQYTEIRKHSLKVINQRLVFVLHFKHIFKSPRKRLVEPIIFRILMKTTYYILKLQKWKRFLGFFPHSIDIKSLCRHLLSTDHDLLNSFRQDRYVDLKEIAHPEAAFGKSSR